MHLVESEIEAERWPGRIPQPLDKYMAFARSLPSQFDDHTWLAEAEGGAIVGCSACWSNAAGDPMVMESYVYVRPTMRRQGAGWQLARAVINEARSEGRSRLVWTTYDSVPAGEELSRRLGGQVARTNRTSELRLDRVDWQMVETWMAEASRRAPDYSLEFWEGPFPPDLLEDAARFHHIMNTAPRDALEVGDTVLAPEQVADIDRHLVEAGWRRWTCFVRSPSGVCVGGTGVSFESWEPTVGFQQNTAIDPEHRDQGLAKWAKAGMLARVRSELPEVTVIRTSNAFSNDPMLAINTALGFEVVEVRTEWQGDLDSLERSVVRTGRLTG